MVLVMLAYWLYQSLHIHRRSLEYKSQVEVEHTLLASRAEIDRLSRQDALTELANRREYERAFQQHWNHAKRSSSDLGLLVLDLDYFKRINDRYGHLAGDACLRHVAQLLKTRFRRDTDTVARIGGEEFAVVLPGNNAVDVLRVAQAVCNELSASPLVFDGHSIGISASIGAGAMQWAGDASAEASFGRIDAACYAAKRLGRNQVVLA